MVSRWGPWELQGLKRAGPERHNVIAVADCEHSESPGMHAQCWNSHVLTCASLPSQEHWQRFEINRLTQDGLTKLLNNDGHEVGR
mmetsp:Transcript_74430/g.172477  ORF Transcript_74430/g.172477 Transcript_74430/m.172477 type:complete len:85 (-) Transcript_74430:97-351(-)